MTDRKTPALPRVAALLLVLPALGGCAGRSERIDRSAVSRRLEGSLGHGLAPEAASAESRLPPGVSLEDGVDEDEAVAIALWNNPAFQEALAELAVQRAEVLQAGLFTNPNFTILFPIGPKQLEFTAKLPLEALFLRGKRLAIAHARAERAAELLVQGGLDLARDVRISFQEVAQASEEAALMAEAAAVSAAIVDLEASRLRAGEASDLEASLARADALRAREEARMAEAGVPLARRRLWGLLGVEQVKISAPRERRGEDVPVETEVLVAWALSARPDLRAAEMGLEEAGERAGLARWEAFGLSGLADANSKGSRGFEIGPGLDFTIPIFHQGQGLNARARAEIERAARHYLTVREGIAQEVREAHLRLRRAAEAEAAMRGEVIPVFEEAVERAELSRLAGEASDREVLDARARLIRTRREAAVLEAARRRARFELERGAGRRLGEEPAPPSAMGA